MRRELLWWEFEELHLHMRRHTRLWSYEPELGWLRLTSETIDPDQPVLFVMTVMEPPGLHRFRRYTLMITPVNAEPSEVEKYLDELLWRFTTMGVRAEAQAVLQEELALPEATAAIMASALSHVFLVGSLDPEKYSPSSTFHIDWTRRMNPKGTLHGDERRNQRPIDPATGADLRPAVSDPELPELSSTVRMGQDGEPDPRPS